MLQARDSVQKEENYSTLALVHCRSLLLTLAPFSKMPVSFQMTNGAEAARFDGTGAEGGEIAAFHAKKSYSDARIRAVASWCRYQREIKFREKCAEVLQKVCDVSFTRRPYGSFQLDNVEYIKILQYMQNKYFTRHAYATQFPQSFTPRSTT